MKLKTSLLALFKILVCLVLAVNLLGAEGGCTDGTTEEPGPDVECVSDEECPANFTCDDNNTCVEDVVACTCPAVFAPVCGEDGNTYGNACEAECSNIAVASEGECGGEVECPVLGCNPYCEYGVRTDANGCETCECNPGPSDDCFSNSDCSNGQICAWGEWEDGPDGTVPPPIPACPDEDRDGICDFDEDQPQAGRCIDPPPTGCSSDFDCGPGQICSWSEEDGGSEPLPAPIQCADCDEDPMPLPEGQCIPAPDEDCYGDADCSPDEMCVWLNETEPGPPAPRPCFDEDGDGQCDDGDAIAPAPGACVPRQETCYSDEECGFGERCEWGGPTPPPIQCADQDGDGQCDGMDEEPVPGYCVPDVRECFSDFDCAPNEHCAYDGRGEPAPCIDENEDGECDESGDRIAPVGYCVENHVSECESDRDCGAGQFCNFSEPPPFPCLDEDGDGECDGMDEDPIQFGWCDDLDESCICPEVWAPVCGEDGNTYGNACEAECSNVAVAFEGECRDDCEPVLCDLWCEFGFQTDPETGCETCACNEAPEGYCTSNRDCDEGEYCQNEGDECFAPEGCPGVCVPEEDDSCICTQEYAPVCGEDGNTYGNACEAECSGAAIAYEGECR